MAPYHMDGKRSQVQGSEVHFYLLLLLLFLYAANGRFTSMCTLLQKNDLLKIDCFFKRLDTR